MSFGLKRGKRALQDGVARMQQASRLAARYPHIIIIPCVLFALMVGLGIMGVCIATANHKNSLRSVAAVDAEAASQALQLAVQSTGLPLTQLSELIKSLPQRQQLEQQFAISAPFIWRAAAQGSMFLTVSPLGINTYAYPRTSRYFNERSIGTNLLKIPEVRAASIQMLQRKTTAFQGPVLLPDPQKTYLCIIQLPIYLPNATANETWGHPFNATDCPPGLCYDEASRTKWWGFASLSMDGRWLFGPDGPMSILYAKGYQYQIWQPPVYARPMSAPGLQPISETGQQIQEPDSVVTLPIQVFDQTWELHVWKNSWAPAWMLPLIAVVVIGAFIVSALLFSTLSSWEEHRALLHSLLPKETIARMRNEAKWAADEQDDVLKTIRLETPAELMLRIIDDCIGGRSPDLPLLLSVRDALHRSADVYRPNEQQMRDRMEEVVGLDEDVRRALTTQLLGAGASAMFSKLLSGDKRPVSMTGCSPLREVSSCGSQVSCTQEASSAAGATQADMQRAWTDHTIKSVRFASSTDTKSEPVQGATGQGTVKASHTSKQLSSDKLASHASACSSVMKGKGFTEEVGTVLASWMLQTSSILDMLHSAHNPSTAVQADPVEGQEANQQDAVQDAHPADDATSKASPFNRLCSDWDALDTDTGKSEHGEQHAKPNHASQADGAAMFLKGCSTDELNPAAEPVTLIMKPILTQLERVLVSAGEWSFDAYALDEASHGRPLSCLGFWLLHSTGIKTWARMNTKRLTRFLERVEEGYANNPYHNRRHAADVLQSVHVLMHKAGLVPGFADQLTLLGCYLAAIVHDFEHVGRTNDFLVNSSDDLAVRYNDRSPMENHHLAAAWALLKAKDCNILSGLSRAEAVKLRKLVIDLVLATDMKQHFAIVGQFETMARQVADTGPSEYPSSIRRSLGSRASDGNSVDVRPVNELDGHLSLQMMLKCADLGHIAAPLEVHLRWVSALEAEFFLQGDQEKALGLPISPLCDRNKEGVTKSQIGFFDFVVLPLFKTFSQRFTGASPMMQCVQSNFAYWKAGTDARPIQIN